ncbi:hypothetical protein H072_8751 [Dactylellina haptotyla CBS 200.50]|uniref:Uncharacterized protein n=1 Tax=Dactylellina haptotyla (strain CBS 200.50) TaxID=1284197 RepID=S8A8T7_DACHA|nr:hypothetical protein H072_8751 [Dactylellina haptotyla CBS 200.50]
MATHSRTHNDYNVGWICALPKEQTAATAMLDEIHIYLPKPRGSKDDNSYTLGSIRNHNVVIACLPKGRTGSVSAASVAIMMVNTFPKVKFGLMVGIGNCIPDGKKNIRLGDVVVSVPTDNFPGVVQWDLSKTDGDGEFQRIGSLNNPPSLLLTALTKLETDHELNGSKIPEYLELMKQKFPRLGVKYLRSEKLVDNLFKSDYYHVDEVIEEEGNELDFEESEDEDWNDHEDEDEVGKAKNSGICRFCDKSKILERKARGTRIRYGLIASGNQLIRDTKIRDKIYKELGNNVLCIETEAAGLVDNFPCLVIRGICNYADSHWNSTWEGYAAAVAAAFARELLDHVEPSEVDEESPIVQKLITIESKIEKLSSTIENKHDRNILEWLGKDYGSQQSDYIKLRQPGTGQWILDSGEFIEWFLATNSILFSPGIPGSGKTITTAILVDYLTTLSRQDESIGVGYVYFNFKRCTEQNLDHVFASLLRQLTQQLPSRSIPETVRSLYNKHKLKETRPSLDEIISNLSSVAAEYSKTFILMDALDECSEVRGLFSQIHTQILAFQATTKANYFATSRFIPDITKRFEKERTLEIRASDSDLRKYLENQCQYVPGIVGDEYKLREYVVTQIIRGVDGMFLLAKLRLESLAGMASRKEVLENLGRNEHAPASHANEQIAYDAAYAKTMDRIQSQVSPARKRAFKVLSWIVFATRTLTLLELQHALAVEKNTSALDLENLPKKSLIIGACCGLVTVDEKSDVIRLIHYTAQEYFKRTRETWFKMAQDDITEICLTYLLYDEFCKPQPQDRLMNLRKLMNFEKVRARLAMSPLYGYAASNWGYHARGCSSRQENLILRFLRNPVAILGCMDALKVFWGPALNIKEENGLLLVAYFGLDLILATLLHQEPDIEIEGSRMITPLLIAIAYGNEATAKILIEKGANPEPKMFHIDVPAIFWAAKRGKHSIVKLLADAGANVELRDEFNNRTALSFAAEVGKLEVVKVLLENGVSLENKDSKHSRTPLLWAAEHNHHEVVEILLDSGANFEVQDAMGRSALSIAAMRGNEAMVKLLVQRGAALEPDNGGRDRTPLSWAATNGFKTIVDFLIANGANLQTTDREYHRTPLLWVASHPVVGGVDIEARDDSFRTSISLVAESERGYDKETSHDVVFKTLLDNGADIEARDCYSWTPLSWAAMNNKMTIAKLLIQKGANLEAQDDRGRNALYLATLEGHETMIRLLLESGADLGAKAWMLEYYSPKRRRLATKQH